MPVKSIRPRSSAKPTAPPPTADAATERGTLLAPEGDVPWLVIRGAAQNNLRNVEIRFPLGRFVCVTGVSGSGKSSLVTDILHAALARELNGAESQPGSFECIEVEKPGDKRPSKSREVRERSTSRGIIATSVRDALDKIIAIDQTPIGRTPRSNPATYIKLFDEIRDLFTRLPDAKLRGYKPGRFSFNVAGGHKGGGRCEACEGNGSNRIEMDFLADVWVTCPVCEGHRFTRETLQIQFKGKSIADVLDMDVQQAIEHFDNQPRIRRMLQTLHDVGLDYIKIGQPSPTLSGGEAQRIKLARELVKRATGRTIYVLDEPTTGLHFEDIRKLLIVLHSFVDVGNTVVVIEHNLDVIKTADWIIDLGPEGGAGGGLVLASGTPEEVAAGTTETGAALRAALRPNSEVKIQNSETRDSTHRSQSRFSELSIPTFEFVSVRGAAQHNLKNIDVAFPRDRMTVCTGVSGSGKTSFAIDTVYTEGHRRYVESLSAYARQFLGQLQKPKVEHVEGLSPAICIEQKAASKSPRSTVGTITEIYDYMRVLWARVGVRFCPQCQLPIGTQTVDEIVGRIMALEPGAPIIVTAPVALGDGETWSHVFNRLKASGYTRVRIDGMVQETAHAVTIDARRKHRVEVVVDRTVVRAKSRSRINEAVEHALMIGNGVMTLVIEPVERVEEGEGESGRPARENRGSDEATKQRSDEGEHRRPAGESDDATERPSDEASAGEGADGLQSNIQNSRSKIDPAKNAGERQSHAGETPALPTPREILFSQKLACTKCGTSYEELSPHHYSFNSQMGWCETCEGLGVQRGAPAAAIIHKPGKSLFTGAIAGWPAINPLSPFGRTLTALCHHIGVDHKAPLNDWTPEQKQALLYGTSGDWISLNVEHRRPAGASTSHLAPHSKGKTAGGTPTLPGYRFHWRGFFPAVDNATRNSWQLRHRLHNVVTDIPCITCRGGRLRNDAAATRLAPRDGNVGSASRVGSDNQVRVSGAGNTIENATVAGQAHPTPSSSATHSETSQSRAPEFLTLTSESSPTLVEICQWPLTQVAEYFANIKLDATQRKIAGELLLEIQNRLQFLIDVGLEYLTLHRAAPTLSGGEAQRIRLASQIGSGLSGVLYVLDEPTIGLHPRDTKRLIAALHKLRGLGNTLLLVEHDREVIAAADGVLDFGPRAGRYGGEIVARGTPEELAKVEDQRSKAETDARKMRRVGSAHQARAGRTGDDLESNAMVGSAHPTSEVQPSTFDLQPSLTRGYLSGELAIPVPTNRRPVNVEAAAALMNGAASEALQSKIQNPKSKIRRPPRNAAGGTPALPEHPGWLVVRGARQNNLKDLTVPLPLGRFVCVTGVSGSGKSSLINDIVWPVLANKLMMANQTPGEHDALEFVGEHRRPAGADAANFVGGTVPLPDQGDGPLANKSKIQIPKSKIEFAARTGETPMLPALHRSETPLIDKVINVDQSPLGATPSSNPATYTGAFDLIRELFARLPDSKLRGYNANRFSFNRPGGRCEACEGYGQKRIEMHFMPDVWVECEICRGKRYEPETLQVRFKEKSIADVLEMRVAEAVELFENVPKVRRLLQRLADVGLDYVQLGQPAPTLSGGEAQRVKLATELGKPDTGRTLYVLDEPTTGLHFEDMRKLLEVLQNLVDLGNTVICVEHNLDVLKCADWIIDLGPEAGAGGGNVVAIGTPEQLTNAIRSRVGSAHQSSARGTAAHLGKSGAIGAAAGVVGNPTLVGGAHPTTASHTAVALAPVLAAGPFADRPVYDRHAHLAREAAIDKAGLGKVGKEFKQPWQIDGKKWHLSQRTSRDGKPRQWQPQALEFVIDLVQQAGEFAPTNWNDRASIEITASGAKTWFLHALTGGEWLIELYFMTPSETFDATVLNRKLGLKTLDEREDIQSYGNWARVDVRPRCNGLDAIAIYVHDKAEIDTPAFRAFIKQAATAYGKIE